MILEVPVISQLRVNPSSTNGLFIVAAILRVQVFSLREQGGLFSSLSRRFLILSRKLAS